MSRSALLPAPPRAATSRLRRDTCGPAEPRRAEPTAGAGCAPEGGTKRILRGFVRGRSRCSPAAPRRPRSPQPPRPRRAAAASHLSFASLQLLQPLLVLHGVCAGRAERYGRRQAGTPPSAETRAARCPFLSRLTATTAAVAETPAPPSSSPRKHAAGESDVAASSSSRRHPFPPNRSASGPGSVHSCRGGSEAAAAAAVHRWTPPPGGSGGGSGTAHPLHSPARGGGLPLAQRTRVGKSLLLGVPLMSELTVPALCSAEVSQVRPLWLQCSSWQFWFSKCFFL